MSHCGLTLRELLATYVWSVWCIGSVWTLAPESCILFNTEFIHSSIGWIRNLFEKSNQISKVHPSPFMRKNQSKFEYYLLETLPIHIFSWQNWRHLEWFYRRNELEFWLDEYSNIPFLLGEKRRSGIHRNYSLTAFSFHDVQDLERQGIQNEKISQTLLILFLRWQGKSYSLFCSCCS